MTRIKKCDRMLSRPEVKCILVINVDVLVFIHPQKSVKNNHNKSKNIHYSKLSFYVGL